MKLEAAQGRPPWSRGAHTPGPWELDATWGLIKHGKSEICAIHSGNLANADLIAAAPILLEALQDIADGGCFDQGPNCLGFVNMEREQMMTLARSAIAKAKGETT
jgi:hypothetical protein